MREPEDLGTIFVEEGMEGHWVVILKGRVIANSENGEEMFKLARKYPVDDVVVTKILSPGDSFY